MGKNMARILKSPKTFSDQICILENRKLKISSRDFAEKFLRHNNYYRVSAYFRPYYKITNGAIQDEFKEWVTFDHIKNLYYFDSELRRMLVPVLERIEVAFRTHLAYYFAHKKGPLAHMDQTNFVNSNKHSQFLNMVNEITRDPKDEFLKHYKIEYSDQYPIWVIIEALSFGNLSKFYSNMKNSDKTQFCNEFYNGVHHDQLKNWMLCMVVLRNICAHHGRVFNRAMMMPNFKNRNYNIIQGYENRIYSMLLIMKNLVEDDGLWNHFVYELKYVIDKYNFAYQKSMGFVDYWEFSFISNKWTHNKIMIKLRLKKIYDAIENKIR